MNLVKLKKDASNFIREEGVWSSTVYVLCTLSQHLIEHH